MRKGLHSRSLHLGGGSLTLYRGSSGWMATAVSPSIVSNRVVATTSSSSLPTTLYAKDAMTPNSYVLSGLWPGTRRRVMPSSSRKSTYNIPVTSQHPHARHDQQSNNVLKASRLTCPRKGRGGGWEQQEHKRNPKGGSYLNVGDGSAQLTTPVHQPRASAAIKYTDLKSSTH